MKISEYVSVHDRADEESKLIMRTRAPYVVGAILSYNSKRIDKIEEVMANLANGRWTGCRVPGYSIFIVYRGNLMNQRIEDEDLQDELRTMAQYVKDVIVPDKPGKYARTANNYYEE